MNRPGLVIVTAFIFVGATTAIARDEPTGSLLVRSAAERAPQADNGEPHALLDNSMFAIAPPEVRVFREHDLVEIIVRESSRAESSQDIETDKEFVIDASVRAFPHLTLSDLLNFQLNAGNGTNLPVTKLDLGKGFEGEGEYTREDDFTARLTAEIVELLPNGNLVLEARTQIKTDDEVSTIMVSGVCRQEDISATNAIVSTKLHDLKIEKVHEGELRKANQKGIISKFFDTLFAF